MPWYEATGWLLEAVLAFFSLMFLISAIQEHERGAFVRGLLALMPLLIVWGLALTALPVYRAEVLIAGQLLFAAFGLALVLPIGDKGALKVVGPQERVDERDIVFARARYAPGSDEYADYYARHPELKDLDDYWRGLPRLGGPGTGLFHPLNSPLADACFEFLEDIRATVEGRTNSPAVPVSPAELSRRLKGLTKYLGAKLVGIAPLNPAYVYSHVGRGLGQYGDEIHLDHTHALVFAVEMDYWMVKPAPRVTTMTESAAQYVEAAKIGIVAAYYLRALGHPARAHIDANYRVVAPPLGAEAGLGELGRIGILMSPQYGPRMRLGVVTTSAPLAPDAPVCYGIQDFCERCLKCAENCPAGAIPTGEKTIVRGVEKWTTDANKCFTFWRKIGGDCALCMMVCPYSKPDAFIHNATRFAVRQSAVARQLSIWADDFFYGRRPRSKELPTWME